MRLAEHNGNGDDPHVLGLRVLGWVLSDDARAGRLLALTGLDPDQLRARVADPAMLGAAMDFLLAHEPDLLACADALETEPDRLAAIAKALPR